MEKTNNLSKKDWDKKIEHFFKKYGYFEDVELGKIPLISDDMTDEEKKLAEDYIKRLIDKVTSF